MKSRTKAETKPETKPTPDAPVATAPVLGADLRGELMDVELNLIIDPQGTPDRMQRPGDEDAIKHLAASMRECGQLQPAMLERLVDGRFARVFGRRRIAAARLLGWTKIRAAVVNPLPDDVRRTVVAVENVQRQDLTPAEETLAVHELMQLQAVAAAVQYAKPLGQACGAYSGRIITPDLGKQITGLKAKDAAAVRHDLLLDPKVRAIACELVAAMLGKPAQWARDRMYIGRLSAKARQLVLEEKLPLAHARELAKVADEKRREELAIAYAAGGSDSLSDTEAGSLEDLQEEVRHSVFALHVVPWNRSVAFAGKPACEACPHNSLNNPGLFEHGGQVSLGMVAGQGTWETGDAGAAKVQAAGVCTMPVCFEAKLRAAKAAISTAVKKIVDGERKPAEVKIPGFVSESALDRKVKERKALSKSSRSGGSSSAHSGPRPGEYGTPLYKARQEWEDLERKVRGRNAVIVTKAIVKDSPGRALCLALADTLPAMREVLGRCWNLPEKLKPDAEAIFAAVLEARIEALRGPIAAYVLRNLHDFEVQHPELQRAAAKRLHITLEEIPPEKKAEIFAKHGYGPNEKPLEKPPAKPAAKKSTKKAKAGAT